MIRNNSYKAGKPSGSSSGGLDTFTKSEINSKFSTKEELESLSQQVGDISSVLDSIQGEVI